DTGSPRRQHQHLQPAGESSDHDYALPSSRPRGLEEAAAAGTETEEEWAAPGGICLHVDRDQVSVEFCSICARRAAASFKITRGVLTRKGLASRRRKQAMVRRKRIHA
ncbi:CREB/ATF bZIP transcription factor, partial [Lamprotornis superbus]